MVQTLDWLRQLYKKETNNEPCTDPTTAQIRFPVTYCVQNGHRERIGEFVSFPTWEYVCWLEEKLSKSLPNPMLEAEYSVATSDPFLSELRKAFPNHTFEYDYNFSSHRDDLLIDGLAMTLQWTHPDEAYLNGLSGEMPDQFATTEDYLKHEVLKQVAEYLTHKGEKNERA